MRMAYHFRQVSIPRVVEGEKDKVVGIVLTACRPVEAGLRRYVDLTAQDRLNAEFTRRCVKIDDTEHVPVVGDAAGRHAKGLGCLEELLETGHPVQKAVLAVHVKMNEFRHL